jgi:endonuclease/exonuclease/phosphatase family metal-dependent hydrolase
MESSGPTSSGFSHPWVGSTHLPRSDAAARGEALRRVAAIASGLPEPWLLVGDFNSGAEWLAEFPRWAASPDPPEATYPVDAPDECIDYCVRPRSIPVRAEVLRRSGSDHFPVLFRCRP